MNKRPKILVCPLDWGIGHASRMVPVVKELIKQGVEVVLAADGRPYHFLKREFLDLEILKFAGYNITYPSGNAMLFHMLTKIPSIFYRIRKENFYLKKIVADNNIDAVISDNRFGLYHQDIPSIFVTHQINVKSPFLKRFIEPIIFSINKFYIKKYNECWIPDFEGKENLSGELSHKRKLPNIFFIGPLSRFSFSFEENNTTEYDVLILLSGPEPQRSILEEKLIDQIKNASLTVMLLSGKPEENGQVDQISNINRLSHLETDELQSMINKSKLIICRPGYSTIMDLVALGKKAVFIPTPGQTEQEYLADKFEKDKSFYFETQDQFNIFRAIERSKSYKGKQIQIGKGLLSDRISNLLVQIENFSKVNEKK